ncbi:MAG TPA: S41 family peptidase [Candidatus Bathyarchaeia archaeon]|nr:S41 family peptidase [Candidatus Bathyarchaeia archaeon]
MKNKILRKELIQDIRQLTNILEETHPDPYINGGGKIAYHRRLQEMILSIPDEGMTQEEFFYHISPFIAKLEDAHTGLFYDKELQDKDHPGGIPLYFIPIENFLVVGAVTKEEHYSLLGAKLISVEDIPYETLIQRIKDLRGFDNMSNLLGNLGRFGMLYFRNDLQKLTPEWIDTDQISVLLALSNGEIIKQTFNPNDDRTYPLLTGESKLNLAIKDRSFAYSFIDKEENIAYLKIDNMISYREAHELFQEIGVTDFNEVLKEIYQKYNSGDVPKELSDIVKGLPSATELFTSLFQNLKKNQSEYLIVDVRKCQGGQDYIILFFLYFILGFEKSVELIKSRSDVLKFSNLLNDSSTKGLDLENIYYYKQVPLEITDYYFGNDKTFSIYKDSSMQIEAYRESMKQMPSFYKEFEKREHEAYYKSKKIIVLSTDVTHSSGFDLMLNLKHIGAKIVGVASGQSGNSFGNIRIFELKESKIKGKIATRFFIAFPEKPMTHLTLEPDFKLTYELFSNYNYDENAILLYTLDLIKGGKI